MEIELLNGDVCVPKILGGGGDLMTSEHVFKVVYLIHQGTRLILG